MSALILPKEKSILHEVDSSSRSQRVEIAPGDTLNLEIQTQAMVSEIPQKSVILKITMEESGPTIAIASSKLRLEGGEHLHLCAKNITLEAEEGCVVKSAKSMKLEAGEDVEVTGLGEVRVRGKMIHLN
ncbi:MAG: hypothetical protein VYA34_08600 [Myxococcota bacterium]|nr:hypothetical protein [Myxococcota bacterium]